MALHRLTSAIVGVPDPAASSSFFTSFGLTAEDSGWFSTRDGGAQLQLREAPARSLRQLGVGAENRDDLERIGSVAVAHELGTVVEQSQDRLVLVEPVTGLLVEVTVAEPYASVVRPPSLNSPGVTGRIDVPAASVLTSEDPQPANLTHVVYGTPDQPTTLRFFTDVLGFEISDEVPGIIAFARCGEVHHNVAIQAAPVAFPHHIAFEMDSIDDVVRGGQRMVDQDPDRHMWGLGRHAIGSNWFWYLRDPSGLFVEYTTDIDRISAQDLYRPKEWDGHEFLYSYGPPTPSEFLEPTDIAELIEAAS